MDLNTFVAMVNQQKVIVIASNDLRTDQRIRKMCNSIINLGNEVELVGRLKSDSKSLDRQYKTKRFKLLFNKGALFYAELNIRLFFYLLFSKADRIHANDLDTLLPAFIVSKIRNKPLVYDTHEIFTEVPEIQNRWVKKVWVAIENWIFPKLENVITVNKSISKFYKNKFDKNSIAVIRNIPERKLNIKKTNRNSLNLPEDKFIVIVQGTGINVDRGTEELILSLKILDNILLLIIGSGGAISDLKIMVKKNELRDKVRFIQRLPFEEMMQYTINADLGITLDKPTSLNYKYSLPNKLFDYIRAGIPVLASNLIEVKHIVEEYNIGIVVSNVDPEGIAIAIQTYREKGDGYKSEIKTNLLKASDELQWEKDAEVLSRFY